MDQEQVHAFLSALYGEDLDQGYFGIFVYPDRGKRWFSNVEEATKYITQLQHSNVYCSVGLYNQGSKRNAELTVGLAAAAIDIDISHEVHTKGNLPSCKKEAMEIMSLGIPGCAPSVVIDSGHGLQGFFVFKEPWYFDNEDERLAAAHLTLGINRTYQFHAKHLGYSLDSVFDLSRIMRVAGTNNVKDPRDIRPVKIEYIDGPRYNPQDFEGLLVSPDAADLRKAAEAMTPRLITSTDGLILNPSAIAPPDKFQICYDNEGKFRTAWHLRRGPGRPKSEGKKEDISLSSMDMTLCNIAAMYGWSDQEMANLIIEFRRKSQQKPEDFQKALRMDYIVRTINEAKQFYFERRKSGEEYARMKEINREINEARKTDAVYKSLKDGSEERDTQEEAETPPTPEEARTESVEEYQALVREKIAVHWGIPITRFVKTTSSPPEYYIETEKGDSIMVGKVGNLLDQYTMMKIIYDNTGVMVPKKGAMWWVQFVNMFRAITDVVDTGEDTREEDCMVNWIRSYIEQSPPVEGRAEGYKLKLPFWEKIGEEKEVFIFGNELRNYIWVTEKEKIQPRQLGLLLSRIGAMNMKMNFELTDSFGTRRINTSVYRVSQCLR